MNRAHRRPYPSDISDEEWEFVAPYLSLLPHTVAQRRHELREVFNAVRDIVRTGALALAAHEFSAVGGGLSADPALDRGGVF
jgi:transposase